MVADPSVCDTKVNAGGGARLADFPGMKEGKMNLPEDDWIDMFLDQEADPHFLYYTRFHLGQIRGDELIRGLRNPYRDPPRSIIGTADGNVYPARSRDEAFVFTGTLWPYIPFEFNSQQYGGMCDPVGAYVHYPNRVTLNVKDKTFLVNGNRFYIIKDGKGRYELPDGTKFDVFYWLFGDLPEDQ